MSPFVLASIKITIIIVQFHLAIEWFLMRTAPIAAIVINHEINTLSCMENYYYSSNVSDVKHEKWTLIQDNNAAVLLETFDGIDKQIADTILAHLYRQTSTVAVVERKKRRAPVKISQQIINRYILLTNGFTSIAGAFNYWTSMRSWNYRADLDFIIIYNNRTENVELFLNSLFSNILSNSRANIRIIQMGEHLRLMHVWNLNATKIRHHPNVWELLNLTDEFTINCENGQRLNSVGFGSKVKIFLTNNYKRLMKRTLSITAHVNEPFVYYANILLRGIEFELTKTLAKSLDMNAVYDVSWHSIWSKRGKQLADGKG